MTTITDYRGFTLETRPATKNTGKEADAFATVIMRGTTPFGASFHVGSESEAITKAKAKLDAKLN